MSEKIFNEERSLFQKKVNEICGQSLTCDVIQDLIKLEMLKEGEKGDRMAPLVEIYCLLGPGLFAELVELLDGKLIQFPSSKQFKETVKTAIYYYYKFLKGVDYKDIDQVFSDDMSHIKLGIKVAGLHSWIAKNSALLKEEKNGRKG